MKTFSMFLAAATLWATQAPALTFTIGDQFGFVENPDGTARFSEWGLSTARDSTGNPLGTVEWGISLSAGPRSVINGGFNLNNEIDNTLIYSMAYKRSFGISDVRFMRPDGREMSFDITTLRVSSFDDMSNWDEFSGSVHVSAVPIPASMPMLALSIFGALGWLRLRGIKRLS
ncbi:hypothetical protein [Roseovarius sp.]|uniref:hypothetical protein n=1 Tax=Roseovarius sp. TaxID=1486281 RepID=UPI003D0FBFDD